MRTALATVCISGTLEDKLDAAALAGFDGVEIFEPDLVASPFSPAQLRERCADAGLGVDLYQPFRDFDSTRPEVVAANLRRAERKFDVMEQLGTDLVLVCSSVAADAVGDDDELAAQLHRLAERAAARGMRVAYEALAWGHHVNTYDRSWEVVRRADHPSLGLCVDSFHILSRRSDPAGIRAIPGEKLFFLQLADAPDLHMDVLQWSRHHRLFPGQGVFDLPAFLGHVLAAGYTGPLSLEVFNDVFRQAEPHRAALDALRSLRALADATPAARALSPLPSTPRLGGYAFAELADDTGAVAPVLAALGFTRTGQHRSKPVQLWEQGGARVLISSADHGEHRTAVAALGVATPDPSAAGARAEALLAPLLPRTRGPAEADLPSVAAPDGTVVQFVDAAAPAAVPDGAATAGTATAGTATAGTATAGAATAGAAAFDGGWLTDFTPTGAAPAPAGITTIDHVALTQPYDRFDEAMLFYRSVLGLATQHASEIAAPFGLVRNRAVSDPAGAVRLCLSVSVLRRGSEWRPGVPDPQHVAFLTDDVLAVARAARAAGAPLVDVPDNYYDDLDARLAPDPALLAELRALGVLLDRDTRGGEFLHFYTEVLGGRVFLEVVQRTGGYAGYGELNSPVRMAAHRRQRTRAASPDRRT